MLQRLCLNHADITVDQCYKYAHKFHSALGGAKCVRQHAIVVYLHVHGRLQRRVHQQWRHQTIWRFSHYVKILESCTNGKKIWCKKRVVLQLYDTEFGRPKACWKKKHRPTYVVQWNACTFRQFFFPMFDYFRNQQRNTRGIAISKCLCYRRYSIDNKSEYKPMQAATCIQQDHTACRSHSRVGSFITGYYESNIDFNFSTRGWLRQIKMHEIK